MAETTSCNTTLKELSDERERERLVITFTSKSYSGCGRDQVYQEPGNNPNPGAAHVLLLGSVHNLLLLGSVHNLLLLGSVHDP